VLTGSNCVFLIKHQGFRAPGPDKNPISDMRRMNLKIVLKELPINLNVEAALLYRSSYVKMMEYQFQLKKTPKF